MHVDQEVVVTKHVKRPDSSQDEWVFVPDPGSNDRYWVREYEPEDSETFGRALWEFTVALLGFCFRLTMRIVAIAFVIAFYVAVFFALLIVFGILFSIG